MGIRLPRNRIAIALGIFIFALYIFLISITKSYQQPFYLLESVDTSNHRDVSIATPNVRSCYGSYALTEFDCLYAGRRLYNCYILNGTQVLLPLELAHLELELSGKVDLAEKLIHIRPSDLLLPTADRQIYRTNGQFFSFHEYFVEQRSQVLLVTADEGIPLSIQWDKHGYPYPIQIAQFGLSHYGKLLQLSSFANLPPKYNEVDFLVKSEGAVIGGSAERAFFMSDASKRNWKEIYSLSTTGPKAFSFSGCAEKTENNKNSHSMSFQARPPLHWNYLLLSGRNWTRNSQVRLNVLWSLPGGRRQHSKTLVYTCARPSSGSSQYLTISRNWSMATFWMPVCASRSTIGFKVTLARDLQADLVKAFAFHGKTRSSWGREESYTAYSEPVLVQSVEFAAGSCHDPIGGLVDTLRLCRVDRLAETSSPTEFAFHRTRFLAASAWLLRNSDRNGGWSVPVTRRLLGNSILIPPGWYSAMGQGHGISLLVRAYNWSGEEAYLKTAAMAVLLYNRTVADGGVQSHFLGNPNLPWYEEYPSQPGNHVLNGFIYSLFGLYDFIRTAEQHSVYRPQVALAQRLLAQGLNSLSVLLPFFDSGIGSFYDLRHVTWPLSANKATPLAGGPMRARWSYHKLHIEQLHLLADIYWEIDPDKASLWRQTAKRWTDYMAGQRSLHN